MRERLAEYYLEREFIEFPDEPTLQGQLATTYAALACSSEETAHRVDSRRGAEGARRKRLREEAELAAATEAALLAKKMKLERQETRREQERRRRAEAPRKPQYSNTKEKVSRWLRDHIQPGSPGDFVVKRDIEKRLQISQLELPQQQLRKAVEGVFVGAAFKVQHCAHGVRHTSAWMQLRWT